MKSMLLCRLAMDDLPNGCANGDPNQYTRSSGNQRATHERDGLVKIDRRLLEPYL